MRTVYLAVALALACVPEALAQEASGTLIATATVEGSVALRVSSPSGAAESNAVAVRLDGSTKAVTIPVTLDVVPANVANCIVVARLQGAPTEGTTWAIDGQQLTESTAATFALSGAHPSTISLHLTVTASRARQVANAVVFSAQAQ